MKKGEIYWSFNHLDSHFDMDIQMFKWGDFPGRDFMSKKLDIIFTSKEEILACIDLMYTREELASKLEGGCKNEKSRN